MCFFRKQNLTGFKFIHSKSDVLKKFHFQIWHVVQFIGQIKTRQKFFIPDLIRIETLNSKSNASYFFEFTLWGVVFFSIQNLTSRKSFLQNPMRCIHMISKSDMYWKFLSKSLFCRHYGVKEWNVVFCMQFILK